MTLRVRLPLPSTDHHWHVLTECYAGRCPAEALDPAWREELVTTLWLRGWTDREIAAHTYMTLYTTVRIRERCGLGSWNHPTTSWAVAA